MTRRLLAARSRGGAGRDRAAPEVVRVRLLGGFGVSVGPRLIETSRWRLRKAGRLVKLLALARGHGLHREQVMDALWPDLDSKAAANNLHRTLHAAREALDAAPAGASSPYLRLRDDLLELCPDGELWVDAEVFEEAAATARRTRDPAAYRAAIDLYAGDLLPEDRYEEWVEDRRELLRQTRLALLTEMAALHEEHGDHAPAIEALERVVAVDPAHEGAHAGLMRLHALSGRRSEALDQYEQLTESLSRKLGVEPGTASRRLHDDILAHRFTQDEPRREHSEDAGGALHNLPAPRTSFVGREGELAELKRALAMTRLMTLTGAGGCGKTRLALEAARDLVGIYPDGVWFVELAPLSDPALVPNALAAVLGVRERPDLPLTAALADYLRFRRTLLVLDNCEHLIGACARLVETLLSSCGDLRVLATSREALRVTGETNWSVPSLTVPGAEHPPDARDLARYEAVRLFVDRARSRLPAFDLTPGNARSVADVCRKLDGIPLAIELATARMTALALDHIAGRLEDSLGLLTTGARAAEPRQRTLKATLAWSHNLLSGSERRLFGRLSVFAGGWTLDAAEEVFADNGAGEDDVPDVLSRLVDKSLVVAEANVDGSLRYRMLEPVRQYARERLEESGEKERVRERHAGYYLGLAERAEPELTGHDQIAWLGRLVTEHANLWSALSWHLDEGLPEPGKHPSVGLRLAAALGRFWSVHNPSEGREWLKKGLDESDDAPVAVRSKALRAAGLIAVYRLDREAITMLEEALILSGKLQDEVGQAASINYLMHAIGILGYHERMPTLRAETEALLEGSPADRRAVAYLQLTLGMMAMIGEDHAQVSRLEEALNLFREVGDLRTSAMCLTIMGIDALGRSDVERAARAFEDTLRLLLPLKDKIGTFYSLMGTAGVAVLQNRPARAARLSGAAEVLRVAIGHPAQPLKRVNYDYDAYLAATREALGEAAFEAAFSEGQTMSPAQAIHYALSADEPVPPPAPAPEDSSTALSRREWEVASLVAHGLTNRQIASKLSISEHTVAAHVRKILKKLGLRARGQVSSRLQSGGSSFPSSQR